MRDKETKASLRSDLNSVLIEGTISRSSEYTSYSEGIQAHLDFEVTSKRFNKAVCVNASTFTIEVVGKQAENVWLKAKVGQSVRIVGRLEGEANGFVKVIAEHIEFRVKQG